MTGTIEGVPGPLPGVDPDGTGDVDELLTIRERVVLEQLVQGLTLRRIAQELYVSRNTVKTQTRSIYRKLGVTSRTELIERVER